jgi:hypothetical protein
MATPGGPTQADIVVDTARALEEARTERALNLAREETARAVELAERRGEQRAQESADRADLRATLKAALERVDDLETAQEKNREWKRGTFVLALVAGISVCVNIISAIAALHH